MVRIIDINNLADSVRKLLDEKSYSVKTDKERVLIAPLDGGMPVADAAQVRFNPSNYLDIFIEELPCNFPGEEESYMKFLQKHRSVLQKMAGGLERVARDSFIQEKPRVVYVKYQGA